MSKNTSVKIKRALLSVSDKSGITELAKSLENGGVEIISTGGTLKHLADAGIKVKEVSDFTGSPEMMEGRVKTLHPKIHAGILSRREKDLDEVKDGKVGIGVTGKNSDRSKKYFGPCPPKNEHQYNIKAYSLNTKSDKSLKALTQEKFEKLYENEIILSLIHI